MPELLKCPEYKEIFEINEKKEKCWIENWDTFVYLAEQEGLTWNELLAQVKIIPFQDLRDKYPVGPTKVKKIITTIVEGNQPRDIFYPEKSSVIRKMAILGTCLPGCEEMWKGLGGTHFYGNRYYWPDYDLAERLGMKVFVNPHNGYDPTETGIKKMVREWKDRPGCGGYWSDEFGGHEPDITGPSLDNRKKFYNIIRELDPDGQNHPVMEMMDITEWNDYPDNQYPGWKNAFSDETHDLLLFDAYPPMSETDEQIRARLTDIWNKFIKVYPHVHQVIPQMIACNYRKGAIWAQYNFWNEVMSSAEFDNPYRGQIGVCWYKDECIRKDEEIQKEIKDVISDAMK